MSKEKQIREYESKQLLDELSKMPPMVIATAYLHAINYTLYGIDVTEKWLTATQNASALEKAYRKGYNDAKREIALSGEYEIAYKRGYEKAMEYCTNKLEEVNKQMEVNADDGDSNQDTKRVI